LENWKMDWGKERKEKMNDTTRSPGGFDHAGIK